ncbi:MAG: DUF378 domain-containing protein [bacterium]|nr:DUF378 domain-containing protein [bacterium]
MKQGACLSHKIAWLLVIIGGINWGLMGIAMLMGNLAESWNVVNMLLGTWPMLEGVVYLLVGISAIIMLFGCPCKQCRAMEGR